MAIVNFIASHKKMAFLGMSIVFFLVFIFLLLGLGNNRQQGTTPTQQTGASVPWNQIQAGASTKQDVIKALGQPVNEVQNGGQTTADFNSFVGIIPHQVVFENHNKAVSNR